MNDCLFCTILTGEIPSMRVYEDENCIGFLDIMPYHRGHTVVIPRRHVCDGTQDAQSWSEVAEGIVKVAQLLKDKLGADATNVLSNAGLVAGQTVFHFHVHVIPRYADNPGIAGLTHRDGATPGDLEETWAVLTA